MTNKPDFWEKMSNLSPTQRALLEKRLAATKTAAPDPLDSIPRREAGAPVPLSFAQQRLWLVDQMLEDRSAYNMPFAARLQGSLDQAALQQSLQEILSRHEVLRTSFVTKGNQPEQVIASSLPLPLVTLDLSGLPAEEREAEAQRQFREEAGRPFDLAAGPLLRFRLLILGEQEHLLLLTMHHIISDAWSFGVFVREFAALYQAYAEGKPSPLSDLPIQYADFGLWQRHLLQGEMAGQLDFWKKQLGGELPVLQLPTDRPRPPVQTYRGGAHALHLPKALLGDLTALSQRLGATLFVTLLSAFQTLLKRYSGQDDILIGTPIAGRNRKETEGLIGFFVNTLVLRGDLSGNPSFEELVGRMRQTAFSAYDHQDVPFDHLVNELQPDRDMSRSPLFQVMFALQNAPAATAELPGLTLSALEPDVETVKFDLELVLSEEQDGLHGTFKYSTDLYDHATIERMSTHFQTLLEGIAANAKRSIADLPLLSAEERRQLLADWNPQQAPHTPDTCAHKLFEAQAEQTPDAAALIVSGERVSYRELNERANQTAHRLRQLGVRPGQLVALCADRSVELVVGLLGVWKAGGAYVPVDPAYPQERIRFILSDTAADVLVTQSHLLTALPELSCQLLLLDDRASLNEQSPANPADGAQSCDLAYMIYTSGSTGKPKAVMVEHRNLVAVLEASREQFSFSKGDLVPWIASVAFDISLFELMNPLLTGGTSVVLTRDEVLDLPRLTGELQSYTAIHTVPSLMRSLVQTIEEQGIDLAAYDGLRTIFIGGDAVPPDLLAQMYETFRHAQIHILYGPTEGTIICSSYAVPRGQTLDKLLIGAPLPHATLRVYDAERNLTPVGVPGELWIGGAGVTRGYYLREDLTAEKYVQHDGETWYRTGDLVRWLADGTLEFLGRIDNQVKIRGFRIETGEIEIVLARHEAVEAAVVTVQEAQGEKRLAAFIVLQEGSDVQTGDLRSFLQDKLPDYMVPSAFVILPELPLNQNGKVDLKALPTADAALWTEQEHLYIAPRTPFEEIAAAVFADVLQREQVGALDNFFELGGHSLLATQVVSRLKETWGSKISLRTLFEHPTVAALAEHAAGLVNGGESAPIPVVSREEALPLSFAQHRLWVLEQLLPDSNVYSVPMALRLQGTLDTDALERSLHTILERHESLRTVFGETDGKTVQIIRPMPEHVLQVEQVSEANALQRVQAEAAVPFDLQNGPLVRFALFRIQEEDHLLLINMHHIISDGWSNGVLINELTRLYAADTEGRSADLPELPIQYADFAVWQREWLEGGVLEGQLAYWKEQLGGELPVLELPTDRPRPPVQTHNGAYSTFELSAETAAGVRALTRQTGSTLFMTLLAGFQTLLSRYTGSDDILVGSPVAGRNRREIEGLIGFFVNTLVLRTDLSEDPSFAQLIARVRETALEAYANQDVQFEMLVDELAVRRDASRSPLFQVLFAVQNAPVSAVELPALTLAPLELETGTAKFDLELSMFENGESIGGKLQYNTDLFDGTTIERMILHLQELLAGAAANPELPLSQLPLLTAAEQQALQAEETAADFSFPPVQCVHRLFETEAARWPERIAVECAGRTITYAELNARANRLAHHLQIHGAGPGSLITLYVDRSEELAVSLLAIWKAGAAYVPIDTNYPPERIQLILEDSGAELLVTEAHLLDTLPAHQAKVICIDRDARDIASASAANPDSQAAADDLAYMIYTSGSTGKPKAVMVEHRNLFHTLTASSKTFGFTSEDTMPWIASAAFDIALFELMNPLLCGGRSVILTRERVLDMESLLQDLASFTAIHAVPSLMRQIVQAVREQGEAERYSRLRLIFVGGDAVAPDLLQAMAETFPAARIHVLYGPTEGTIICSSYEVPPTARPERLVIGKRLPHALLRICDKHQNQVPNGIPGELYIGGSAVTRGYFRRDDLTAEKYVEIEGVRWYKTGDSVRRLPDGTMEFLGRLDHQVKIRGFRIELGEIDAVLASHPHIRETLTVVHETPTGDKRLAAYVVPEAGEEANTSELRLFVKEKLPEYMVPSAFVTLPALPLNQNGKVDRSKLPQPDFNRTGEEAYQAPRTQTEATLAAIWANTLRLEKVGIHDNFFELGGDSILSIQIIQRAKQQGVLLTPKDLFRYQTIARLAEVAGTVTEEHIAEQGMIQGDAPLLPVQHWFFEQNYRDAHHNNQSFLFETSQPLDLQVLQEAAAHLLKHHDALRLRFHFDGTKWGQTHAELGDDVPVYHIDLADLPPSAQEAEFAKQTADWQSSLNLSTGPLVRFVAFRMSEQAYRLLLVVHHLVIDGVSWRILAEDLETAYGQRLRGEEMQLPLKTSSYKQWAEQLTAYAQSETALQEREFWLEQTAGEAALLPVDHTDGDNREASAASFTVSFAADETNALLQNASKAYSTQINDMLLTALSRAFHTWTGQSSLLLTMEGHGREEIAEGVDVSRTIGWFTSTYPVRLTLPVDGDIAAGIKSIKEQLRLLPNRGIGYGILRWLSLDDALKTQLGAHAHPQVSFNYLGQFNQQSAENAALPVFLPSQADGGPARSLQNERAHLLDITAVVTGGQLHANFIYSSQLHREDTIARLAQAFADELRAILAHTACGKVLGFTPSDFPLARLEQSELDSFLHNLQAEGMPLDNLETMYELSPMQQGMLYHSLLTPESSVYVSQMSLELQGSLNVTALRQAWESAMERHPILRTSFHWHRMSKPLQAVHKNVSLPFAIHDWQDVPEAELPQRLQTFLKQEQSLRFDLDKPPLMRLAIVKTGEQKHRLVWTSHHLLLDGWSLPILQKEVFSEYEQNAAGDKRTPRPVTPFADYIAWLQRQDAEAAKAFWQRELQGFSTPTALGLPQLFPEQAATGHNELRTTLSAGLSEQLQMFAKQHQLTLNTVLQGAYAVLLNRYSGEEDLMYGMTVSGRPPDMPGVEEVVGLFINTLPVRVQINQERSVLDFLHELQNRQTEMREYEYAPLSEIQKWSVVPRDAELFQTIFVFENFPQEEEIVEELSHSEQLNIIGMTAEELSHYPLQISASPGREIAFKAVYDSSRYGTAAVQKLLVHLEELMAGMTSDPAQSLAGLTLSTEQERKILEGDTSRWELTERIPDLFAKQAAITPDATAVRFENEQLSYRELNERANQVACHLQAQGVGPEVLVTVCLERSLDLVVGLLGILKSGGAFVPLDPAFPQERIALILEDTASPVLLTQERLLGGLPVHSAAVICLDRDAEEISRHPMSNPHSAAEPEHLAYMIYTSGSTGRPKAVMVEHRNLTAVLQANQELLGFNRDDVLPWISSVSFDMTLFELFQPLLVGACCAVLNREHVLDTNHLIAELETYTRINTVPSLMRHIAQSIREQKIDPSRFDRLNMIFMAGDAVAPDLLHLLHEVFRNAQVYVLYGPTEATLICSYYEAPRDTALHGILIGERLLHAKLRICDPLQKQVPAGVIGELYIGGPGVTRGYYRREDLTADKFVELEGERWYRAGDSVRLRSDGQIEFLGRIDNQVKIRGYRIELGEIETVLALHDAVLETVLHAWQPEHGEKLLVAYVVGQPDAHLEADTLRSYLKERLPEYMVPSAFVILDALPLNHNGKIDRRALPAPDTVMLSRGGTPPQTPLQQQIADIFADVLNVEAVSLEDNFFELGGHSLLVTQVISRLNDTFGVELALRVLFEAPTVAQLEAPITRLQSERRTTAHLPLQKRTRDDNLPLSYAQQRLWVLDRLDPESAVYNMPLAVRLQGELNLPAVEQSVTEIIRRHETLRTAFTEVDGAARQTISAPVPVTIPVLDLQGVREADVDAEVKRLIEAEAGAPFDLSRGPLLRAKILQLGASDHVFVLNMHHIVTDGWSMGMFMNEFATLYRSYADGQDSPLPELIVQYADYALWQRDFLQGPALEGQLAYWKQTLSGELPVLQLPSDHPRPPVQTHAGALVEFVVPEHVAQEIRALCQRTGTTLFMTLLAAFKTLLYRYTGQEDLTVGSPVAGRNRLETEALIGFFVNTLVMRTDLSGDPSFEDLLHRVRETALGAYSNQDVPFEMIVDLAEPVRDPSRSPLFQALFALQQDNGQSFELPGLTLHPVEFEIHSAKFDLEWNVQEKGGLLVGALTYNTALFDRDTITRMTLHLQELLAGIAVNPKLPLSKLPLLTEAEQHALRQEDADAAVIFPQPVCAHRLIEEQVKRTPDHVAVESAGETLTYAELNARANRFAHHLRAQGVGPGSLVTLYVERSAELVVSLLAILKAGGAYVPIDTHYPPERIALILEDTDAQVLVTQESLLATLPVRPATVVCIDRDAHEIAAASDSDPASGVTPDDLAYMIYTSGSTGKPKAVMVEHKSLFHTLLASRHKFEFAKTDVMPWIASVAFDIALFELINPLLAGGRSVVLTREQVLNAEYLLQELTGYTAIHTVPSLMRQIVQAIREQGMPSGAYSQLRLIFIGGDAVAPDLLQAMQETFPAADIHVLYGPTEGTIICSSYKVPRGQAPARMMIGTKLPHAKLRICDRHHNPVPLGVHGELLIGGAAVTRGYYRRDDLTQEKYVLLNGERWYKTGDSVRRLPDGTMEFLGRIDHQVKIRGFRVELGEIETTLTTHPEVREALVVVFDTPAGDKRLAAYVVPETGEKGDTAALRSFLKEKLPEYMVPSAFVVLEAMPLNQNGKVDRSKLPQPDLSGAKEASHQAPRTRIEQELAEIWAAVLRAEAVGIHDNFFALGGDSILSIQIIHKANQRGIRLTPKDMFKHQTIAELAAAAGETAVENLAEQGQVTGTVKLLPVQSQFLQAHSADPHHFNMPMLFELQQHIEQDVLEDVFAQLLTHHDMLRARYSWSEEGWQQTLDEFDGNVPLVQIDLSGVPEDEQEMRFTATASEQQRSLQLSECPLRIAHFHFGGARNDRLLFAAHHLLVDGVSWRILFQDLETALQQRQNGDEITLPPKTTSFQTWAERLAAFANDKAMEQERTYWRSLAGREFTSLPVDHRGGKNTQASVHNVSVSLSETKTKALLQEASNAYNTRINDLLLTALSRSFAAWTDEREILITLEGHGREDLFDDIDLTRTVGWFTTTYPLHLHLSSDRLADGIKEVKEQLRALPRQGIGYGILREWSGEEALQADLKSIPHPEVSFNYLGQFNQGTLTEADAETILEISNAPCGPAQNIEMERSHLVEINSLVAGGCLQLSFAYSSELFEAETIQQLADAFVSELNALIDHCLSAASGGRTPSDFPEAKLSQRELDRLLTELSGRGRSYTDLEALTELSPMQEGMLFHSLLTPDSGVYVTQVQAVTQGDLETNALKQAWQTVMSRHPILRTAFYHDLAEKPLQAVCKTCEIPLSELDWRAHSREEQAELLQQFLREDSGRGFSLEEAPLMRLTLIRTGKQEQRLIWTSHHLLLDGWSLPIVFREMFAAYQAHADGKTPALGTVRPYREFIAWLQEQDPQAAEEYWRSQMSGFAAPTKLHVEQALETLPPGTDRYGKLTNPLSADSTVRLQQAAKQHQLTLNTLVQGAWSILLARYSAEEEVVYGTTVSGRPADLAGVEEMVGLFINTLPVRRTVTPGQTLLTFLQDLQVQQAEMREFEYAPLQRIQEWSDVPRGLPLFETLFVFENYPMDDGVADAVNNTDGMLQVTDLLMDEQNNFPLTVIAMPGRQLRIRLSYDRKRYDDATIKRMSGHLLTLLEQFAAHLGQAVDEVPMLSAAEAADMLTWHGEAADAKQPHCLHMRFAEQAGRTPDRIAVVCEGNRITYRELNERANRLAHSLIERGVGAGSLVGLCADRSVELIVGVLGILKAGAAYLPLDPSYPQDRLAFMLEDSQIRVLVTHGDIEQALPAHQTQVVDLTRDWPAIAGQSAENPAVTVSPDSLAYVIYTSGSTGKPKGVLIPHQNVSRLMDATDHWYRFDEQDVWTLFHSYAFDFSVWEIWGALLYGGRLVVVPYEVSRSPEAFYELLAAERITVLNQTPSAFRQLMQAEERCGKHHDLSLRYVIFGGEALELRSLLPWFERHGDQQPQLVNMYGITETTVHVTYRALTIEDARSASGSVIGVPIPDLQVYVLDHRLQPVPYGVVGEMYVGGAGTALGYLNRADLTAERFLPDPFGEGEGRLYKTGDLARILPSGELEYFGRIDHQVKLRGFRIELGEIESVLLRHPAVREAVVIVREDEPGDKRLAAYLVSAAGEELDSAELRAFTAAKLPVHMVPAAFVVLDAIPLTANGKINTRALPKPDDSAAARTLEYLAPRDEIETKLAEIYAHRLGVQQVGVSDNFFALGGHSLLAVRLMADIQQEFGQKLPLAALYQGGTIEHLATALRQADSKKRHSCLIQIQQGADGDETPLFLVHPGGGLAHAYVELAQHLEERTVYAFQSQGLEDDLEPLTTIEEMAATYLEAMYTVQPKGPYLLGGWSLGGTIAYEMAQRLEAAGEEVAFLGLFDTSMPRWLTEEHEPRTEKDWVQMFAGELANKFGVDLDALYAQIETMDEEEVMQTLYEIGSQHGAVQENFSLEQLKRTYRVFKSNVQAQETYDPQPSVRTLTIFVAEESVSAFLQDERFRDRYDELIGWRGFAADITSHTVPGSHQTMMEPPHAETAAKRLQQCLIEATAVKQMK